MFAVRVAAFVISVLFLVDAVEPTEGWFIALVVLTGRSILGWGGRPFPMFFWGGPWNRRWRDRRWRDDRWRWRWEDW